MRWWMLAVLCAGCLLSGCNDEETTEAVPPQSLLTFRYDAARDVVIASTHPLAMTEPLTPQRYADALAALPETSYAPSPVLQLAHPQPLYADGVLAVNYLNAAGLEQLSSAQSTAVLAALEAWWWVPGVNELRVQVNGQPLTTLGSLAVTQPLRRTFQTFVVQPVTGEVGYLVGSLNPTGLANAVEVLRMRAIREFPALQGFRPLLPADLTITAASERVQNGTLPVELSAAFPRTEHARLAGMVLMLTQFPEIEAVDFSFGGVAVDEPFMRGNLNSRVTPYDLLLPPSVGSMPNAETQATLRAAVQQTLGQAPAAFGAAVVWRDWASVTATPMAGTPAQLFILRNEAEGYRVLVYGTNLPVAQMMQSGVTREAIIALRLPGWEAQALHD